MKISGSTNNSRVAAFAMVCLMAVAAGPAFAQRPTKAPDYKLSAIKVVPFEEKTGKFDDPIVPDDGKYYYNNLSTSLFVTFEITGEAGSFESGRFLNITVTEGKRIKASKKVQVGLIGEEGKYYIPVFLESAMCDNIKITARLTGQRKTAKPMSRLVTFVCRE